MRKVIYTEFNGISCSIEKEGWFHGFFQNAIETNDGEVETFTEALIEIEDGSIVNVYPPYIRFVDSPEEKPEDDKLAEFAKAAMQGMLANSMLVKGNSTEGIIRRISEHAVLQAKSMIDELKKQK